jgi:hypothetical protein
MRDPLVIGLCIRFMRRVCVHFGGNFHVTVRSVCRCHGPTLLKSPKLVYEVESESNEYMVEDLGTAHLNLKDLTNAILNISSKNLFLNFF